MGGKTWQQDEEEVFWLELLPLSPEGLDPELIRYSWREVAEAMTQRLGHKNYRAYNAQLIYEHFYQNCRSNHPSPRAKGFVNDYMRRRGRPVPENPFMPPNFSQDSGDNPIQRSKPKQPRQHRRVTSTQKARFQAQDQAARDARATKSPPVSYGFPPPVLAAPYQGGGMAQASAPATFDRSIFDAYGASYRPQLPSGPRMTYNLDGRAAIGYGEYPVPSSSVVQGSIPMSYNVPSMVHPNDYPKPGTAAHAVNQTPMYPVRQASVPAPPMTLEPHPESGNIRPFDASAQVPKLRTREAARLPRLPGLITPTEHGPKFDALLSAASSSSAEPSPNSSFTRSGSFSNSRGDSPATVVGDNGPEGEYVNKGKGRAHPQYQQTWYQ